MFQVQVKTGPVMTGAYTYLCASREERDALVRHPSVWWWHVPEEDDWSWHRGPAWKPAHRVTAEEVLAAPAPAPRPEDLEAVNPGEDDDERW